MRRTVAVTVEQELSLVLDHDFRIVEVGPAARATFGPLQGQLIYEAFPDCEALFRPYYERARRIGSLVEFGTYYDGYVLHLQVRPRGDELVVTWETLAHLDVLTLDGLVASLATAQEAIVELERELERGLRRSALRVVEEAG